MLVATLTQSGEWTGPECSLLRLSMTNSKSIIMYISAAAIVITMMVIIQCTRRRKRSHLSRDLISMLSSVYFLCCYFQKKQQLPELVASLYSRNVHHKKFTKVHRVLVTHINNLFVISQ